MKFLIVILILAVLGMGGYIVFNEKGREVSNRKIDSLVQVQYQAVKYDSIESAVEKKILDSAKVLILELKDDLAKMKAIEDKRNKRNEDLYRKFNAIVIDRPEF